MKASSILFVLILLAAGSGAALAGGPESGFFLGGAAHVQLVPGTGTWDTYDFRFESPLSTEGESVGFNWTDKMLLGLRPMVGFKLSHLLALQVGYALNIKKSSQQSITQYNVGTTYEQGYSSSWDQKSLEIIGVLYPSEDLNYYFYGGVDMTRVNASFTFYEGVSYTDNLGNPIATGGSDKVSDKITATGAVLGAGIEFPSEENRTTTFVSAQYSTARTGDTFFGTPDFKVDVGGFSFMVGVKWFLFND